MENRRVIRGIVDVIRDGFRWNDAPNAEGPHKTLSNRVGRWRRLGVCQRMFDFLVNQGPKPSRPRRPPRPQQRDRNLRYVGAGGEAREQHEYWRALDTSIACVVGCLTEDEHALFGPPSLSPVLRASVEKRLLAMFVHRVQSCEWACIKAEAGQLAVSRSVGVVVHSADVLSNRFIDTPCHTRSFRSVAVEVSNSWQALAGQGGRSHRRQGGSSPKERTVARLLGLRRDAV